MIKNFFDWLFGDGNEGIYLMFIFSVMLFFLGLGVAFVTFTMPYPLLRFEILMVVAMFSIFATWHFRVHRK